MDSPGHCAQFCTYTLMEKSTKKILSVKTLDKRETEGKSGNLEKAGFIRGMQEVQDSGLKVAEVVTDAHIQIGALMSKYTCTNIYKLSMREHLCTAFMFMIIIKMWFYLQKRIILQ